MAFKALFIAHIPDADYRIHKSVIDTGMYKMFSVMVKNQEEALLVAKEYFEKEGIQAISLCPGFTNSNVGEISSLLNGQVSVNVSRGDGPSNKIAMDAMKEAGFFDH